MYHVIQIALQYKWTNIHIIIYWQYNMHLHQGINRIPSVDFLNWVAVDSVLKVLQVELYFPVP